MFKRIFSLVVIIMIVSCTPSYYKKKKKRSPTVRKNTTTKVAKTSKTKSEHKSNAYLSSSVKTILKEAKSYEGTKYQYGGNTRSGIDCSGLVCNAYSEADIKLPRRSADMANEGKPVKLSEVKEGDLLFFATSGGSTISHVAIVHHINDAGEVFFIHSSSSKGVTISSLEETYWKNRFVKAKRIVGES